jgi:hypothetical protein
VVETIASSQNTTVEDHSRCSVILAEDGKFLRVDEQIMSSSAEEQDLDTMLDDAELTNPASESASTHEQKDSVRYAESQNIDDPEFEDTTPTSIKTPPSIPIDTTFLSAKLDFSDPLTFQVYRPNPAVQLLESFHH